MSEFYIVFLNEIITIQTNDFSFLPFSLLCPVVTIAIA